MQLKIPFRNLHVAANDAHFTLRAILMIAFRTNCELRKELTSDENAILSKMKDISPVSLPPGTFRIKAFADIRRIKSISARRNKLRIRKLCEEVDTEEKAAVRKGRKELQKEVETS